MNVYEKPKNKSLSKIFVAFVYVTSSESYGHGQGSRTANSVRSYGYRCVSGEKKRFSDDDDEKSVRKIDVLT